MPAKVVVRHSPRFNRQYEEIQARAARVRANGPSFHEQVEWMVGNALRTLAMPHEAFAPYRLLDNQKHDLSGISRFKGVLSEYEFGLRIFYLASEAQNKLAILELGERKPGDPGDAYEVFAAHLKAGEYDAFFRHFGLRHAYWQIADAPVPLPRKR